MKKKRIITLFITGCICLMIVISIYFIFNHNQKYSYEWEEVKTSSIGQYRLFVNDVKGRHINGSVRLVYINGKSKRVDVDKKGLLYVKSIVLEVRNPNKR